MVSFVPWPLYPRRNIAGRIFVGMFIIYHHITQKFVKSYLQWDCQVHVVGRINLRRKVTLDGLWLVAQCLYQLSRTKEISKLEGTLCYCAGG
jgi:hypothetical protein